MKKTLVFVMAVAALMFSVVSCNQNVDPKDKGPKILDLRNKKADGSVLRAARDAAPEFKAELLLDSGVDWGQTELRVAKVPGGDLSNPDERDLYSGEDGKTKIEEFAKSVKITSHKDGFQFDFTTPEGLSALTGGALAYVDGNGNKSTGAGNDSAISDGKWTTVCPLVIEGKTSKFWFLLYGNGWEAGLFYNITPVNGLGCVDDFPEDYNPANYVHLEDGHLLKINNTIPPMAKNLKHNFLLVEQDTNDIPYGNGSNNHGIGNVDLEDATEEELVACDEVRAVELTIDLTKYTESSDKYEYCLSYETNGQNKPYVFAMFWWTYTLDNYPGYKFSTPGICSNIIENTDFKKKAE